MENTPLTDRQQQVMKYVMAGKADKEIGALMFISEETVADYLRVLFRRFAVHNRTHLVVEYLKKHTNV